MRTSSRGQGALQVFPAERAYPKSGASLPAFVTSRAALTFLKPDPVWQVPG